MPNRIVIAEELGRVLARLEHEWECDSVTIIQGPCNCDRLLLANQVAIWHSYFAQAVERSDA